MASYSSMKSRYVWLTETDWRDFADVLATTFPTLRYYARPKYEQSRSPAPPEITFHRHLLDVVGIRSGGNIIGTFDESWRPDFGQSSNSYDPNLKEWVIRNASEDRPRIMIQMWHWYTAEQLEAATFMECCRIIFYREPGNKEHDLLSRHFYRLLGKFATNKDQTTFHMPGRQFQCTQKKGSLFWLGRDAIRWVKEDPERVFFYTDRNTAFRPDRAGVVGVSSDADQKAS